jgi:hypothetical protein
VAVGAVVTTAVGPAVSEARAMSEAPGCVVPVVAIVAAVAVAHDTPTDPDGVAPG